MPNSFKNLEVDDPYDPKKNERKAKKMITAIEKLKKKDSLSEEERIKIEGEDKWRKILDPFYENPLTNQNQDTEKEHEMREKKNEKKRKRCNFEQEQRRRSEEQERQRRSEEQLRQHRFKEQLRQHRFKEQERQHRFEEQKRRRSEEQERRRSEEQERRRSEEQDPNSQLKKRVQQEITVRINLGYTKQKVYQQMYLKYHPDKNRNPDATQITQFINQLKEQENMDTNPCQKN